MGIRRFRKFERTFWIWTFRGSEEASRKTVRMFNICESFAQTWPFVFCTRTPKYHNDCITTENLTNPKIFPMRNINAESSAKPDFFRKPFMKMSGGKNVFFFFIQTSLRRPIWYALLIQSQCRKFVYLIFRSDDELNPFSSLNFSRINFRIWNLHSHQSSPNESSMH